MNKVILTVVGVSLALAAAVASAGTAEKTQLADCKVALEAVYGDDLRTRLVNVRRRSDGTHMRIRVTPKGATSETVVCTQDKEGVLGLTDRDGVALAPTETSEKVSLVD